MGAKIDLHLTDQQLKAIFNSMSIRQCKRWIRYLNRRVEELEMDQNEHTGFDTALQYEKEFLDMPIDRFALSTKVLNAFQQYQLKTVRDLVETGVERIRLFRNVGEVTLKEVKQVIFQKRTLKPQTTRNDSPASQKYTIR